jgi:microcystin-dependent protein
MSINIYHASNDKLEPFDGGMFYSDCPIGTIIPYGGSTIPNGFLLCDGSEVLKTSYSELYSIIGDSFGTASDNTRFVLPDMRESVPVGSGTRGSGVSAHDTYTVGQFKDDQFQNHTHSTESATFGNVKGILQKNNVGSDVLGYATNGSYPLYAKNITAGRSGSVTHGKQLGVNYIIKAAITLLPLELENAVDECVKKVDVQSSAISGNNNPISSGGAYIELAKKADKATTLSGYNIDNAYTKDEIDNKISELVTSMTWKPAVATYDDIATTYPNPQEGWTVVTTDTNIAWRYTNGAWIKISANTIPVVTSEVNGLMTSAMLSKLNGIAEGAEVNVQSDWNETDTTSDAYIANKPTIPSEVTVDSALSTSSTNPVQNKIITNALASKVDDTDLATVAKSGSYNDLINKPTIPTNTSQLINDSDFVIDSNYVHTDNNFTTTLKTKLNGIASGAEVNVQPNWTQTNTSADDYIKNKPKIPTKTSDLTNDSGFDSPVVLTKNLAAGATSLTFTDASIGNNSRIIIYTKPYSQGVVTGATQSGTSVTITCAAQSSAYDVSIEIRN